LSVTRNRILAALNAEDREALQRDLQPVVFERGTVLLPAGEQARYAYFPTAGIVSIVAATGDGSTIQVAMIGREGVAGLIGVLGRQGCPYDLRVELAGEAQRIPAAVLRCHLLSRPLLLDIVHRYLPALGAQVAQSVLCNRYHTAHQRLARWLLLTADCSGSAALPLTHEGMAQMVGGPRSAVTEASATLRAEGCIDYTRGTVRILDERALEREACECYGTIKRALNGFLAS
jgi:CRP-like cAMP-binding protein